MFLSYTYMKNKKCYDYINVLPIPPIFIDYNKRDFYSQVTKDFNDYFKVIQDPDKNCVIKKCSISSKSSGLDARIFMKPYELYIPPNIEAGYQNRKV